MADQLLTGTTLVESSSRSQGDVPVGGVIEWDDTYANLPEGYLECNGATVNDPLSSYNGATLPNYNTDYWSCTGTSFVPRDAGDATTSAYATANGEYLNSAGVVALASVLLPHNAVITGVVIYCDGAIGNWFMMRQDMSAGTATQIATAAANVEDTTITNAIVDNSEYSYYLYVGDIGVAAGVYGARITYTTRQKFIIRIR